MTNTTATHPTRFYYNLQTAYGMGVGAPPSYSDSDVFMCVNPYYDEEAFHAIACQEEERVELLWFQDVLWAYALRNRLRALGVGAVVAADEGPGWCPKTEYTGTGPSYVVMYRADTFDQLADSADFEDLACQPVELFLTLHETDTLSYLSYGLAENGDAKAVYWFKENLSAVAFSNVLNSSGRPCELVSRESTFAGPLEMSYEVHTAAVNRIG